MHFFSDNEGPEEDPSTGEDDFFTLAFLGGGYDATAQTRGSHFSLRIPGELPTDSRLIPVFGSISTVGL